MLRLLLARGCTTRSAVFFIKKNGSKVVHFGTYPIASSTCNFHVKHVLVLFPSTLPLLPPPSTRHPPFNCRLVFPSLPSRGRNLFRKCACYFVKFDFKWGNRARFLCLFNLFLVWVFCQNACRQRYLRRCVSFSSSAKIVRYYLLYSFHERDKNC